MTRKIFAELAGRAVVGRRRAQCIKLVQPISWNNIGDFYQELGEPEHRFLARPFEVRSWATARPEWRGHDPITEDDEEHGSNQFGGEFTHGGAIAFAAEASNAESGRATRQGAST